MTAPYTEALRTSGACPPSSGPSTSAVTVPPAAGGLGRVPPGPAVDRLFADAPPAAGARLLRLRLRGRPPGAPAGPPRLPRRGRRRVAADARPLCRLLRGPRRDRVRPVRRLGRPGRAGSVGGRRRTPSTCSSTCRPWPWLGPVLADLHRALRPGGWCKVQTVDIGTDAPVTRSASTASARRRPFLLECGAGRRVRPPPPRRHAGRESGAPRVRRPGSDPGRAAPGPPETILPPAAGVRSRPPHPGGTHDRPGHEARPSLAFGLTRARQGGPSPSARSGRDLAVLVRACRVRDVPVLAAATSGTRAAHRHGHVDRRR